MAKRPYKYDGPHTIECRVCKGGRVHRRFWSEAAFIHHVKATHGSDVYFAMRKVRDSAIYRRAETETRVTSHLPVRAARVLTLLDEDPGRTWTAKELAGQLDKKWGATRQALSRLSRLGRVHKPYTGGYRSVRSLVREGPFDPRLRFHGLKVFYLSQNGPGGISSRVVQRMSTIWASPANHRVVRTGAHVFYGEWNGRLITASAYPRNSRLEVFLTSTLKPLNLIELHTFFAGVVPTGTGIAPELWRIQQMGANVDLPGARIPFDFSMSFPDGLSVAGFEKGVFRAYEKLQLEAARLEAHLYSTDARALDVGEALRIMEAAFSSLEGFAGARP